MAERHSTALDDAEEWFIYACRLEGELRELRRLFTVLLIAHARTLDLTRYATAELDRTWPRAA